MTERMLTMYNTKLFGKWNRYIRKYMINTKLQKQLKNKDFTILCNNCLGGIDPRFGAAISLPYGEPVFLLGLLLQVL